MSQKKHAPKSEKQAVEKPPIELSDDQLDKVQGGIMASAPTAAAGGYTYGTGGGGRTHTVVDSGCLTKEEADHAAQAIFDSLAMNYVPLTKD